MLKTYSIPKFKLEVFNKRIAKMSSKAKRLGLPEYKVEFLGEEIKTVEGDNNTYNVTFVNIQIEGDAPQIDGYNLVAMLEQLNGENIVRRFDKETESVISTAELVHRTTECDHCGSNRKRKYIFVLENEGELFQVGKSCLKDFTNCNYSAESIAKYYEDTDILYELEYVTDDDFINYGSSISVHKVDDILAISMYFTIKEGYKPSSYAMSTKQEVCNYLFERNSLDEYKDMPSIEELVQAHTSTIEEVKKYFAEQPSNSDYIHNLQVILKSEFIEYKHFGYTVSAFSTYLKAFEREINKKREVVVETVETTVQKDSEYVGEVGERNEYNLTFDRLVAYEGFYGVGYMYFFKDGEGNVFLWGTNKELEFEKGENVLIVGTIKEHKEFRDVKQTVITRCKIK